MIDQARRLGALLLGGMRFSFVICILGLLLSVGATGAERADRLTTSGDVATRVVEILSLESGLPLPIRRHLDALRRYYGDDQGPLIWTEQQQREQLLQRMEQADRDGLKPSDYPSSQLRALLQQAQGGDVQIAASAEIYLTSFFLNYASDLKVGRFIPRKIDPELFVSRKTIDGYSALQQLRQAKDLSQFFRSWQPQNPEYRALRLLLRKYLAMRASGGWPTVEPGDVLKPGMNDPRVGQMRARLMATEDITSPAADPNQYDAALVMAVKRFQDRHGLQADGVVGKQTQLVLNIPLEQRIRQIIVNLERWRWMPEDLGDHYIFVNIAGFELKRVRSGFTEERMRVVVGKPFHRTPVFSNRIRYLEFNPTWNVPYSIATKEFLPKLQNNPSAYSGKTFTLLQDNQPLPFAAVDWSQYSTGNFPFQIRQEPGGKNALGRVKFMFPNKHNIYLHDTPSRSLFSKTTRAFSHGCIRLARPIELANQVLRGTPGWSRNKIKSVLTAGETQRVNLATPLPVHLTYATAWLGEGGTMHFRPDIYGRDKRLYRALFAKQTP